MCYTVLPLKINYKLLRNTILFSMYFSLQEINSSQSDRFLHAVVNWMAFEITPENTIIEKQNNSIILQFIVMNSFFTIYIFCHATWHCLKNIINIF